LNKPKSNFGGEGIENHSNARKRNSMTVSMSRNNRKTWCVQVFRELSNVQALKITLSSHLQLAGEVAKI